MTTVNKKASRLRRAGRTRHAISRMQVNRLCVYRSSKHIYAQLISPCGSKVLFSASSVEASFKSESNYTGNIESAKKVGLLIAKKCLEAGIKSIAFDRSGYQYHGRIKALADAAR